MCQQTRNSCANASENQSRSKDLKPKKSRGGGVNLTPSPPSRLLGLKSLPTIWHRFLTSPQSSANQYSATLFEPFVQFQICYLILISRQRVNRYRLLYLIYLLNLNENLVPLSDNTADNLSGSGHAKHRRVVEAFREVIRIVFERNIQLFCSKHGLMRLPEAKVDDVDDTSIVDHPG